MKYGSSYNHTKVILILELERGKSDKEITSVSCNILYCEDINFHSYLFYIITMNMVQIR